jgi:hypothetical protein
VRVSSWLLTIRYIGSLHREWTEVRSRLKPNVDAPLSTSRLGDEAFIYPRPPQVSRRAGGDLSECADEKTMRIIIGPEAKTYWRHGRWVKKKMF